MRSLRILWCWKFKMLWSSSYISMGIRDIMSMQIVTPVSQMRPLEYLIFYWAHLCNLHDGLICIAFRLSVCLDLTKQTWPKMRENTVITNTCLWLHSKLFHCLYRKANHMCKSEGGLTACQRQVAFFFIEHGHGEAVNPENYLQTQHAHKYTESDNCRLQVCSF